MINQPLLCGKLFRYRTLITCRIVITLITGTDNMHLLLNLFYQSC